MLLRGPVREGRELGYLLLRSVLVLVFLLAAREAAVETGEESLHGLMCDSVPRCRGSLTEEASAEAAGWEEERGDGARCLRRCSCDKHRDIRCDSVIRDRCRIWRSPPRRCLVVQSASFHHVPPPGARNKAHPSSRLPVQRPCLPSRATR